MKQTLKNLTIAALVILGAMMGCTGLNDELQPVDLSKNDKVVTVTTTVSITEGTGTKALTNKGVKTFADGEQIAVVYTNKSNATKKATSTIEGARITYGGKAVSFTVDLTDPKEGPVTIVYPAAMVDEDGNETSLSSQNGTLATIASTYDYATAAATLSKTGDVYTLTTGVELVNQLAIGEFTIEYPAGTPLTQIKSLTVNDGTNNYVVTAASDFGTGPIYVAMKPITSGQTLTLTATKGVVNYSKSVAGKALAAGEFCHITLQMTSTAINLALLTGDYEAQNGDVLTGTLNKNVKLTIADGATVTLDGVNINGSGTMTTGEYAGLTCLGDATIILKENTTNTVKGFDRHYPGIQAGPTGKTLTIQGSGSLDASSNGTAPGIGVKGEDMGGNISIEGGTIVATGGSSSAAIGTGASGTCGTITISSSVISVTANKGSGATNSIGKGNDTSTCGTVTIGFKVLWDGSAYQNGGGDTDNGLPHTPYVYPKPLPVGAIAGLFRINAAGDQVYFSKGNLQCKANSTGAESAPYTPEWRFAENQWDYIGDVSSNSSPVENQTEWMDLFGWGTKNNPTKADGSASAYSWNEWGDNPISNAESGWKTLTQAEISYILKTRATGITINGKPDARYALATVKNVKGDDVKGLIIIPDNYCGPVANVATDITWSTINGQANYSTRCTAAGWSILEAAGCVFLPAGGWRSYSATNPGPTYVEHVQTLGHYWTRSNKDSNLANDLRFTGGSEYSSAGGVKADGMTSKRTGLSVRLVKSAN